MRVVGKCRTVEQCQTGGAEQVRQHAAGLRLMALALAGNNCSVDQRLRRALRKQPRGTGQQQQASGREDTSYSEHRESILTSGSIYSCDLAATTRAQFVNPRTTHDRGLRKNIQTHRMRTIGLRYRPLLTTCRAAPVQRFCFDINTPDLWILPPHGFFNLMDSRRNFVAVQVR